MNTKTTKKPSFFTLLMMISFASVNAVLFTPALPNIANFFTLSPDKTQNTITYFLVGYALGQLIYGPIANRYGRKPALYLGVGLQIVSSLFCIFAGIIHEYSILIIGRFLLAFGSGVGLNMAFTLVNECYEPKVASQKISYLILAFAISPALAVALGGILNEHFGWMSCFYAGAIYGFILLFRIRCLPETQRNLNYDALKIKNLFQGYIIQFKNSRLIAGGVLMGGSTSFVYVFAALAPFIAINLLGMNSAEYGIANVLPAIGLILGSLCSAQLVKTMPLQLVIRAGILITGIGVLSMMLATLMQRTAMYSIFLPMTLTYFGLSFVMANASSVAMSYISDKAQGSAVMSFINMGIATLVVLSLGLFRTTIMILPTVFLILCFAMIAVYKFILSEK